MRERAQTGRKSHSTEISLAMLSFLPPELLILNNKPEQWGYDLCADTRYL